MHCSVCLKLQGYVWHGIRNQYTFHCWNSFPIVLFWQCRSCTDGQCHDTQMYGTIASKQEYIRVMLWPCSEAHNTRRFSLRVGMVLLLTNFLFAENGEPWLSWWHEGTGQSKYIRQNDCIFQLLSLSISCLTCLTEKHQRNL